MLRKMVYLLLRLLALFSSKALYDSDALAWAANDMTGMFFNLMPSFTDDAETCQAKSIPEITKVAGAFLCSARRLGAKRALDPDSIHATAVLGKSASSV